MKKLEKSARKKIAGIALLSLCVSVLLVIGTVLVAAYFSSKIRLYTADDEYKFFRSGMELNTFFDQLNSGTTTGTVATGTSLGIVCTDTSVKTSHADLTTVTIDNVTYYSYNPDAEWGSASNPYIISRINHLQNLYVLQNCGFFETLTDNGITEADMPYFLVCTSVGTPATIDGTDKTFEYIGNDDHPFIGYVGGAFADESTTVDGKSSSQSAIYHLCVKTADDVVDVGLFGRIGYLGDDSTANSDGQFSGSRSTVRDLLLYDVTVVVEEKTTWQSIVDATAHLFSFNTVADVKAGTAGQENHHVGILAGHVEYATVEYISVYYSSTTTAAIDVNFKTASTTGEIPNFYSVSGILGFVYEMNSVQANGVITQSGVGVGDIELGGNAEGTGGGLVSGTGRGYVTAAEIYNAYSDSGKIVKVTTGTGVDQKVKYGLLVQAHDFQVSYTNTAGNSAKTNVTLADGTPVSYADDLSYITTYSESKNFFGATEVVGQNWTDYVVHDMTKVGTAQEYWYRDASGNTVYATQSQIERTGVSLKFAAKLDTTTNTFENLCIQYERARVGSSLINWTQTTGRYYFYDGVFTFALSEQTDCIEETWKGTAGTLTVGPNDDSVWTQDEAALPNSVLAFIKPVTSAAELINTTKEVFIAYKDGDSYHIVTLAQNSNYNAGEGDNAVTTNQTTLNLADSTMVTTIGTALTNGTLDFEPSTSATTLNTLKSDWAAGKIQVLNLGSTGSTALSLEQLKNRYQVKVSSRTEDPTEGLYEDDGETAGTTTLQNNAKAATENTYYSVTSLSQETLLAAISDSTYGTNFTYFMLVGSTTVNLNNLKNAVDTNNNTYKSQETANSGATVSISDMQSAINTRNNTYYDLNGTAVDSSAIQGVIDSKNNKWLARGSNNNDAEITSIANIQTAIDNINSKYYWLEGVANVSGSNPLYFKLADASKSVLRSTIESASANKTSAYYYESDGTTLINGNSSSPLNTWKDTIVSGGNITQKENYSMGYIAFETNGDHWNTSGYYRSARLYYVDVNGTRTELTSSTSDIYRREYESDGLSYLIGRLGLTEKKDLNSKVYYSYTKNNTTYEGPLLYLVGGTYYSGFSCANATPNATAKLVVVQNSSTNVATEDGKADSRKYVSTYSFTTTYHYIVETITGTGITYTFDGISNGCTFNGKSTGTVSSINKYNIYNKNSVSSGVSKDYDLYSCTYSGTTYEQCILIVRYNIDGTFVKTTSGEGITYSFYNGSSFVSCGTPEAFSGQTLTVSGSGRQLYKDGTHLGVMVANFKLDGILLDSLTGAGTAYSVKTYENSKITDNGAWSGSCTTWDIGQTVTADSIIFDIYRSSDGKLGVRAHNQTIDGILLQSVRATGGYGYSVIDGSTKAVITASFNGSSFTDTGETLTAGGKTYTIYRSADNKLGVRLENEHLDGILLTSDTGAGLTYSLINGSGTKLADLTSSFNPSFTANFAFERTLTVGGQNYVVYANNGKLGIRAQNFVVDGVIVQTQTGTGVSYALVNNSGTTQLGTNNLTFEAVTGRTVNVDGVQQIYKSSDNHYCLRAVNIKTDGYITAEVYVKASGTTTNYKFMGSSASSDVPLPDDAIPTLLPGLTVNLSNGSTSKAYNLYVCNGKLGIQFIHVKTDSQTQYEFWHEGNTASSDAPYYLRILRRIYARVATQYSMICSTDTYAETADNFDYKFGVIYVTPSSVNNSTYATVIFEKDDSGNPTGAVYLQYTVSGTTRYLSYDSSSGYFNSSSSQDENSKLYLFTAEGTHTSALGENIVPVSGAKTKTFNVSEAVLWPENVYLGTDATASYQSTSQSPYATDTSYTIKTVSDLVSMGWKNRRGGSITKSDLGYVFSLGQGISDVNMMNLWGGNTGTILNEDGYVKAPVGTTGEESFIPTGCVAFRINTESVNNRIRVIVAVPTSNYYYGAQHSSGTYLNPSDPLYKIGLDYSKDYTFCMWKVNEANSTSNYQFSSDNCVASFELPRSTPYDPATAGVQTYSPIANNSYSTTDSESVKKYVDITYDLDGDKTAESCRAYLNGEQVLVAYEFTANEEGIYLLGSTQTCRIVFFSADASANAERDGQSSYKTGTIDFVFDDGTAAVNADGIITSSTEGTTVVTVRDSGYVASLALLFTDNSSLYQSKLTDDTDTHTVGSVDYPNINQFAIYVKRWHLTGSGAHITWKATGGKECTDGVADAAYIQFIRYSIVESDSIRRDDDEKWSSP